MNNSNKQSTRPLGELGEWCGGSTPSKSKTNFWKDGSIPWTSPKDMKTRKIVSTQDKISDAALQETSLSKIPAGSVLIVTRSGILQHSLPVALAGVDLTINQDLKAIVPGPDVEPEFLSYAITSHEQEILRECSKSGTTVASIDTDALKNFEVPVPPLSRQRQIVRTLDALTTCADSAESHLTAIPPLVDKFRQSVLASAFSGELTADWRREHPDVEPAGELLERIRPERKRRWIENYAANLADRAEKRNKKKGKAFTDEDWQAYYEKKLPQGEDRYEEPEPVDPDEEDLPEIPETWEWVRLEEMCLMQNGKSFPSKHYSDNGVKLLRPGNMRASGRITWEEERTAHLPATFADHNPRYEVTGNELVMNLTAQSLKDAFLGRICLTADDEYCLLNQRLARIEPISFDRKWMFWLFKAPVFRNFVDDGLNTGTLIQHLYTSDLREFVFPAPPTEEQRKIVQTLEERLNSISDSVAPALAGATEKLNNLRASLLHDAFNPTEER